MSKIVIYTTNICPYCIRAKELLSRKNLPFKEINVTNDSNAREALVKKANGQRTVPQIFINDTHIGGHDDLVTLERSGKLDKMVQK